MQMGNTTKDKQSALKEYLDEVSDNYTTTSQVILCLIS